MIGAIIGDIIGSVYEHNNVKTTDFQLFSKYSEFTDDTVTTIAVADWLINAGRLEPIMLHYGRQNLGSGYGSSFLRWLRSDNPQPYNSFGNGSAMRVCPVGYIDDTIAKVRDKAMQSAIITHNHPEGIKGAEATAACVFLARNEKSKNYIRDYIKQEFHYNLERTCDDIRLNYSFDVTCQGSVPQAIIAFLESTDYESAIRLAVSLGGDSDTIACITGGIAEAYYKEIPRNIVNEALSRLPQNFIQLIKMFYQNFNIQTQVNDIIQMYKI
jgi:ADP-ribosyl-[dinitrogen reductase] hydrolase